MQQKKQDQKPYVKHLTDPNCLISNHLLPQWLPYNNVGVKLQCFIVLWLPKIYSFFSFPYRTKTNQEWISMEEHMLRPWKIIC